MLIMSRVFSNSVPHNIRNARSTEIYKIVKIHFIIYVSVHLIHLELRLLDINLFANIY